MLTPCFSYDGEFEVGNRQIHRHMLYLVSQTRSKVRLSYITSSFEQTVILAVGYSGYRMRHCLYSFHHPVALIMNIHEVLSSCSSLLFIYRTCRALCSNRGQTWTRLEMP